MDEIKPDKAGKAAAAANSFGWPEEPFAQEVARSQDGNTILFRASLPLAEGSVEWSEPVRFMFERRDDGTFDMVMTNAI